MTPAQLEGIPFPGRVAGALHLVTPAPGRAERELWSYIERPLRALQQLMPEIHGRGSPPTRRQARRAPLRDVRRARGVANATIGEGAAGRRVKAAVGAPQSTLPHAHVRERRTLGTKPRGYAGDYPTIARIYENRPRALVGRPILDRCFLPRRRAAVWNRRRVLAREIGALERRPDGRARVMSLACGPAENLTSTRPSGSGARTAGRFRSAGARACLRPAGQRRSQGANGNRAGEPDPRGARPS